MTFTYLIRTKVRPIVDENKESALRYLIRFMKRHEIENAKNGEILTILLN